jgi:hypothetical protein
MISRTVSLSLVTKDFASSRASLDAILVRHNGYAAELNTATPLNAVPSLEASLRIPAPQLPATLAELKSLDRVEGETQNGEEVTRQHGDLHVNRQRRSRRLPQRSRHASRNSSLLRRIPSSSNLLAFLVLDSCPASVASLVPRRPSLVNARMASVSFSCGQIQSIGVNVTEQGANQERQPWRSLAYISITLCSPCLSRP